MTNIVSVGEVYEATDAEMALADEIEAERMESEEIAVLATRPWDDPIDEVYRLENPEG